MNRPFRLGLTGSVGMGKTTVAGFFAEAGIPVWDADAAVHRLYRAGAPGAAAIARLRPQAIGPQGVDRTALSDWIFKDPKALAGIEAAIHPLVSADRAAFLQRSDQDGAALVLLEIPLLYETGADADMDAVLVVTAPAEVQRARVLARPGVTEERLALILSRQMPDAEKRARADHVIDSVDLETTRRAVQNLIGRLAGHA